MLCIQPAKRPRQMENTIALINIVFLMLIFFLIAGTIAPTSAPQLNPLKSAEAEETDLQDMLTIQLDGTLVYAGKPISAEGYVVLMRDKQTDGAELTQVRVYPDRDLPATRLLEVVAELSKASGVKITVISERSGQ